MKCMERKEIAWLQMVDEDFPMQQKKVHDEEGFCMVEEYVLLFFRSGSALSWHGPVFVVLNGAYDRLLTP